MMYSCERWTIRKSERRKFDAFELWCWRRILRIPWTERRTKKSFGRNKTRNLIKGMIVKQALTFFGHTMQANGKGKDIMLGTVASWPGRPEGAKAPLRKCCLKIRHFLLFVGKSQKLIDQIFLVVCFQFSVVLNDKNQIRKR